MGIQYWGFIAPSGQFFSLQDYGTKFHESAAEQIISSRQQYYDLFDSEREHAVEFLLRMGWVRVNQGTSFEVGRWDGNTKSNIIAYLAQLKRNYNVTIDQFHPESNQTTGIFNGDVTEVLTELGAKEGLIKTADWQQYLQTQHFDVSDFWRYVRKNQVWSFMREGAAQKQDQYVNRFVRVLGINSEIDQVHGIFGNSVEEVMQDKDPSEGQPAADQWTNITFVQSVQQPVISNGE